MCGFAGLIPPPGTRSYDPETVVRAMVQSLEHRGPDDVGFHADPSAGVFVGFRRLSILDLSEAGHQPMSSASGRYTVTFNGEIYNFLELRRELQKAGARFRGHSDTEVMLAAFERWGCAGTLPRLRGMFAFALWDAEKRLLHLARDRVGIKPLYLLHRGGGVAFASEARAFHRCPLYDGRGDLRVARTFLRRLYVPGRDSILAGVERIRPGEVISFEVSRTGAKLLARESFWDLSDVAARGVSGLIVDEKEAVDGLLELLRESVRMRLVADVPVGAFLSGGIDSSVVVGLMQELSTETVRTFTIGFDHPDFDEGAAAADVARHLGTHHTSVRFSSREIAELIPTLPGLSDEPMANPSLLPTLLVSRVARQHVVVALSGDGGDELFGGYNRYLFGARLIRYANRLPGWMRRLGSEVLAGVASSSLAKRGLRSWQPGSLGKQHPLSDRLMKMAGLLGAPTEREAYESLLDVGMRDAPLRGIGAGLPRVPGIPSPDGSLEAWMMLTDQLGYLPDDLLTKVDRASMWVSLEARVPLLDHEVVEFSWRIPTRTKLRSGVTKWPLREIAYRYVPRDLLERPKMGFTAPVAQWLRGDLREWARDTLSPAGASRSGLWDGDGVARLWSEFDEGHEDLALPLWTATVLQAWAENWNVRFEQA